MKSLSHNPVLFVPAPTSEPPSSALPRGTSNAIAKGSCSVSRRLGARALLTAIVLVIASGCANYNYKRLTYDLLRQEDCRRNDLDNFCARSFVFEYDEYEQVRQEYIRNKQPNVIHTYDIVLDF